MSKFRKKYKRFFVFKLLNGILIFKMQDYKQILHSIFILTSRSQERRLKRKDKNEEK